MQNDAANIKIDRLKAKEGKVQVLPRSGGKKRNKGSE